jgi:hypothetical protein
MARPHNPYEDPAVRRRHRRLVQRAWWLWSKWTFLSVLAIGVLFGVIAFVTSLVSIWAGGASGSSLLNALFIVLFFGALGVFIAAPMGVLGMVLAHGKIRRTGRAFGPRYCKICGYSLRDLTVPKCPECGRMLRVVGGGATAPTREGHNDVAVDGGRVE